MAAALKLPKEDSEDSPRETRKEAGKEEKEVFMSRQQDMRQTDLKEWVGMMEQMRKGHAEPATGREQKQEAQALTGRAKPITGGKGQWGRACAFRASCAPGAVPV